MSKRLGSPTSNGWTNCATCWTGWKHFRDRYILLPNVSEGGGSTILRKGFAHHYREMSCDGGYLDGSVDQHGVGNRGIVEGKNHEYGQRKIGLFQTSDNRSNTFNVLGKHSSWVKWATPTAEALRQACLACDTRISHEQPSLPAMVVSRIEVSDSKFLNQIDLQLNPQFNCLIGGRGTGKSTMLEYLRWALCDQPPAHADQEDAAPYQEKRSSLIADTLAPKNGVVTVSFQLNSVMHVVRRAADSKELKLKIGSGEYRDCTEQQVRDLLPIQAYSQKQLSAVGTRSDELKRFIRTSIKADLDALRYEMEERKTDLRRVFSSLVRRRKLQRVIDQEQTELTSLTQQVDALRRGLGGLTESDRAVLEVHDVFLLEEQFVERLGKQLQSVREMADDFRKELLNKVGEPPANATLPNAEVLNRLRAGLGSVVGTAAEHLDAAIAVLGEGSQAMSAFLAIRLEWETRFAKHQAAYEAAKDLASSQQDTLKQIAEVDMRVKALRSSIDEKQNQIRIDGASEEDFQHARLEWRLLYTTAADLMQTKCNQLTSLSSGRIQATINRGAGGERIKARLAALVAGSGMRSKRVDELCDSVTSAPDPALRWAEVADELELLIDYSGGEANEPRPRATPLLSAAGFGPKDVEKIAGRITPEEWIELALTELEDVPQFKYRQSEGFYIDFAQASAGQQATALLRVLLNQEGPPLVIDQPEEDLDNQVLQEIVVEIGRAKKGRQLIFSSHNPNIVVNGDADLVVCCDYKAVGDHSGGRIKCSGAIDVEAVRQEITVVMEGGRDAFRLRKQKYGF